MSTNTACVGSWHLLVAIVRYLHEKKATLARYESLRLPCGLLNVWLRLKGANSFAIYIPTAPFGTQDSSDNSWSDGQSCCAKPQPACEPTRFFGTKNSTCFHQSRPAETSLQVNENHGKHETKTRQKKNGYNVLSYYNNENSPSILIVIGPPC
jgi:hypothetical protein